MHITSKHKSYSVNGSALSEKLDAILQNTEEDRTQPRIGSRHLVILLGFLSLAQINASRLSLAVAIVRMSNTTAVSEQAVKYRNNNSCPLTFNNSVPSSKELIYGEFDWSSEKQGLIIGAGFLGFSFTLLIGGRLSEKYSAKWVIFGGNLVTSLCILLSPFAARWNVYCMIMLQLIRGIGQGLVFPSTVVMATRWLPPKERGLHSSFMMSGFYFGAFFGGLVSGFICDSPSLGWPFVFYIFGILGVVYSVFFAFLFYDTPQQHPRISKAELKYISEGNTCSVTQKKKPPIPWNKMMTSVPVYALFIAIFGFLWSVVYFLSVHPLYLGTILHVPIRENGLLSSLPFIFKIIGAWSASWLSGWLTKKDYVSVNISRKAFNFAGSLLFALSLLGAYFAKCNVTANFIVFILALFSIGIATPGAPIASIDMTPNFAGTLQGLSFTVGMSAGFIIPTMISTLTKQQTIDEWHVVFCISGTVVLGSSIIFGIWGSAEVQAWNSPEEGFN